MTTAARISLVAALTIGGVAAFLVRETVRNIAAESVRANLTSTIVVARKGIAFGAPLTPENLQEVPWQTAEPLEGSFQKISDVVKDGRRLALVSMQRNEPILVSRVTGANQRATLSTQLDEGMRAVTIRVDEVRGVAGFIVPGDRVDIISTRGEGGSQDAAAFADVLLQNAKVLAIDQLADERQDKPTVARAVTLELGVQQAQKVVLAQGIGRLSLVLRQANAIGEDAAARVSVSDLGNQPSISRDQLAEIAKRLEELKVAADAARSETERNTNQKLVELEGRLRGELHPQPALTPTLTAAVPAAPSSSVVNVIRNGSKTESYTVAAEP